MGLFDLFKRGEEPGARFRENLHWIPLETEEQLEELIAESGARPQIIFKNSTSCGISDMVKRSFESRFSPYAGRADLHLLHIQYNRELSYAVARRFGIRHESPQLLIIRNGMVVEHASHGGITDIDPGVYV